MPDPGTAEPRTALRAALRTARTCDVAPRLCASCAERLMREAEAVVSVTDFDQAVIRVAGEAFDAARAQAATEARRDLLAKVEGLDGTEVLDGRGIGTVHEPTRAAVMRLIVGGVTHAD